jgi:hypothetical protein
MSSDFYRIFELEMTIIVHFESPHPHLLHYFELNENGRLKLKLEIINREKLLHHLRIERVLNNICLE